MNKLQMPEPDMKSAQPRQAPELTDAEREEARVRVARLIYNRKTPQEPGR